MQPSQIQNVGLPSCADTKRDVPAWTQDPKIFPLDWFSISRPNIIRQTKEYVSELSKWRNCPKIKTLSKLKAVLKRIMMFLHTHISYIDSKSLVECDLEEDLITLVSLYMDMELRVLLIKKSAATGATSNRPESDTDTARNDKLVSDRISYWLYTVLTGHDQRVDALLSTTVYTRHTRPVLDPIYRKLLSEMPDGPYNNVNYVRHMLAYKTWRERTLVENEAVSEELNSRILQRLVPHDYVFPPQLLRCLGNGKNVRDHIRPNNVNLANACRNFMRYCREMPAAAAEQINFESIPLLDDDMLGDEENEINNIMNMISNRKQRKSASASPRSNHQVDAFIDLTLPKPKVKPVSSHCVSPTTVSEIIDLTDEDKKPIIPPRIPTTVEPSATTSQRASSPVTVQPQDCSHALTPSSTQVETRCFRAYRDQDFYFVNISCMCPFRTDHHHNCQDKKIICHKDNKQIPERKCDKDSTFVGRCFQFSIGKHTNKNDAATELERVKLEMKSTSAIKCNKTDIESREESTECCDNLNRCDCEGCKNLTFENRTCTSAESANELSERLLHPASVAEIYAMEKATPIVLQSQPSTSRSGNNITKTLDKRKIKCSATRSEDNLDSVLNEIKKIKLPVVDNLSTNSSTVHTEAIEIRNSVPYCTEKSIESAEIHDIEKITQTTNASSQIDELTVITDLIPEVNSQENTDLQNDLEYATDFKSSVIPNERRQETTDANREDHLEENSDSKEANISVSSNKVSSDTIIIEEINSEQVSDNEESSNVSTDDKLQNSRPNISEEQIDLTPEVDFTVVITETSATEPKSEISNGGNQKTESFIPELVETSTPEVEFNIESELNAESEVTAEAESVLPELVETSTPKGEFNIESELVVESELKLNAEDEITAEAESVSPELVETSTPEVESELLVESSEISNAENDLISETELVETSISEVEFTVDSEIIVESSAIQSKSELSDNSDAENNFISDAEFVASELVEVSTPGVEFTKNPKVVETSTPEVEFIVDSEIIVETELKSELSDISNSENEFVSEAESVVTKVVETSTSEVEKLDLSDISSAENDVLSETESFIPKLNCANETKPELSDISNAEDDVISDAESVIQELVEISTQVEFTVESQLVMEQKSELSDFSSAENDGKSELVENSTPEVEFDVESETKVDSMTETSVTEPKTDLLETPEVEFNVTSNLEEEVIPEMIETSTPEIEFTVESELVVESSDTEQKFDDLSSKKESVIPELVPEIRNSVNNFISEAQTAETKSVIESETFSEEISEAVPEDIHETSQIMDATETKPESIQMSFKSIEPENVSKIGKTKSKMGSRKRRTFPAISISQEEIPVDLKNEENVSHVSPRKRRRRKTIEIEEINEECEEEITLIAHESSETAQNVVITPDDENNRDQVIVDGTSKIKLDKVKRRRKQSVKEVPTVDDSQNKELYIVCKNLSRNEIKSLRNSLPESQTIEDFNLQPMTKSDDENNLQSDRETIKAKAGKMKAKRNNSKVGHTRTKRTKAKTVHSKLNLFLENFNLQNSDTKIKKICTLGENIISAQNEMSDEDVPLSYRKSRRSSNDYHSSEIVSKNNLPLKNKTKSFHDKLEQFKFRPSEIQNNRTEEKLCAEIQEPNQEPETSSLNELNIKTLKKYLRTYTRAPKPKIPIVFSIPEPSTSSLTNVEKPKIKPKKVLRFSDDIQYYYPKNYDEIEEDLKPVNKPTTPEPKSGNRSPDSLQRAEQIKIKKYREIEDFSNPTEEKFTTKSNINNEIESATYMHPIKRKLKLLPKTMLSKKAKEKLCEQKSKNDEHISENSNTEFTVSFLLDDKKVVDEITKSKPKKRKSKFPKLKLKFTDTEGLFVAKKLRKNAKFSKLKPQITKKKTKIKLRENSEVNMDECYNLSLNGNKNSAKDAFLSDKNNGEINHENLVNNNVEAVKIVEKHFDYYSDQDSNSELVIDTSAESSDTDLEDKGNDNKNAKYSHSIAEIVNLSGKNTETVVVDNIINEIHIPEPESQLTEISPVINKEIILEECVAESSEITEEVCEELCIEATKEENSEKTIIPFGPSVEMLMNVEIGLESCTFSQKQPLGEYAKEGCAKCSVNGKHKDNKRVPVRGIHQYQQNELVDLDQCTIIPAISYCQAVESVEPSPCVLTATVKSVNVATNNSPLLDNYNLCILADIAMNSVHLHTKNENNNVMEVSTEYSNDIKNQSPMDKDERCIFVTFGENLPVSGKPSNNISIINNNCEEVSVNVQKIAGGVNPKGITLESKIQALTERAKNGTKINGENLDELCKSLENICELEIDTLKTPKIPESITIDIPNTAHLHLTPDDDDFMIRNEPFSLQPTSEQSETSPKIIDSAVKNLCNEIDSIASSQKLIITEKKETRNKKTKSKSNNQSNETSYLLTKYKNKQDSNNQQTNNNKTVSPPSYIRSTRPMRMVTTRKRNNNENNCQSDEPTNKVSASEKMFDKLLEEHKKELSEAKVKNNTEEDLIKETKSVVDSQQMPTLQSDTSETNSTSEKIVQPTTTEIIKQLEISEKSSNTSKTTQVEENIEEAEKRSSSAIEVVQEWFNRVDNNKELSEPYTEITSYQTIEECNFFEEISSTSENSPVSKTDDKVFSEHQTPDSGIAFDEDSAQKDKSINLSDGEAEQPTTKTYFCSSDESEISDLKVVKPSDPNVAIKAKLVVSIALERIKDILPLLQNRKNKKRQFVIEEKEKKRKHSVEEILNTEQSSCNMVIKDFKFKRRKYSVDKISQECVVEDFPATLRTKGSVKEYPECLFGITESPVPSGSFHSPYPSDISLTEEPAFYEEGGIDLCNDYPCYDSFEVLQEQQSLQKEFNVVDDNPKDVQQGLQAGYCVVDSQFLPLSEYMNDGDYILIDNKIFNDKRMVPVNMHQVQPETKPHNNEEIKRSEFDDSEKEDSLSETVEKIIKNPNLFAEQSTSEVQVINMDQTTSEVQVVIACDAYQDTELTDTYLVGISVQTEVPSSSTLTENPKIVEIEDTEPENQHVDAEPSKKKSSDISPPSVDQLEPNNKIIEPENQHVNAEPSKEKSSDIPPPSEDQLEPNKKIIECGNISNEDKIKKAKSDNFSIERLSVSDAPVTTPAQTYLKKSSPVSNAKDTSKIFQKPARIYDDTKKLPQKESSSNAFDRIKSAPNVAPFKDEKKHVRQPKVTDFKSHDCASPHYVSNSESQKSNYKTYRSKVPLDAFDKLKLEKCDVTPPHNRSHHSNPVVRTRYRHNIPSTDYHKRYFYDREPRSARYSQSSVDSRGYQSTSAYRPPSDPPYRNSQYYNYKKPEVRPPPPKKEHKDSQSSSNSHLEWMNDRLKNLIENANTIYKKKY